MLVAEAVVKRFGEQRAVDGCHLQVSAGEIYCLLGANGAGKTTLINLFLGFLQADAGRLAVGGFDPATQAQQARSLLSYIPEQVMLYPLLSGIENLRYFHELGTGQRIDAAVAHQALREAGLPEQAPAKRVSSYSKGMRQKVGIAIAKARQAKVLLLDEPTSGLDPQAASEFSVLLRQAASQGVAVLTTSHDLFHAKQTAHRIGIMRAGRLVFECVANDITLEALQHHYLQTMQASA